MSKFTLFAAGLVLCVGLTDSAEPGLDLLKSRLDAGHEEVHEHRSPGKPGAQVWLDGPDTYSVQPDEPQLLKLRLRTAAEPGQLLVTVKADKGLELSSGESDRQVEIAADGSASLPLQVTATEPGDHFVHLFVRFPDGTGAEASRALAVAVRAASDGAEEEPVKNTQTTKVPAWVKLPVSEAIR